MTDILTPDICVIGGGSGGLSVAAAAAQFGVDVVLIEKGAMGGDCLNTGCVPSKALIAAAKRAHIARSSAAFGIADAAPAIDFSRVHDHIHGVIGAIAPHDSVERFTGLGVRVIKDRARFIDPDTVAAGPVTIKARRFVVATGSHAATPPIPGLADVPFLTNESVFDLTERPEKLVIIGGGPIGMELAQSFARLGSAVTVLEAFAPLGKDDPDLVKIVLDQIAGEGVEIRAGAKITGVSGGPGAYRITLASDKGTETLDASHLLVAAGRAPNLDGLGLEAANVAFDRRGITVGKDMRSSNRRVYAIGDVAGSYQFTHMAGYHAGLVVRAILFRLPVKENRDIIPWVTYTDPELAHVGLGEAEARRRHGDGIRVLSWTFRENDRAQATGETSGKIKVITTRRGRILGADIVGPEAGELINLWALAIANKMKIGALTKFVAPYPTLSEISRRVAISYYAPSLTNNWVRRIIAWLGRLG